MEQIDLVGAGTLLQGFTITGGVAPLGGGVYLQASWAELRYLTVIGNQATDTDGGGGIHVSAGSPLIADCVVSGNSATASWSQGGGISLMGQADVELERLLVEGNDAYQGAGVCAEHADFQMTGSLVRRNAGQGVYLAWADAVIEDSVIAENDDRGLHAMVASSLAMDQVRVLANHGGGLYLGASPAVLTNVAILDNHGTEYGAGINMSNASFALSNVVIAGNHATTNGGGISVTPAGDATFEGVIIVGNTANNLGGGITWTSGYLSNTTWAGSMVWGNDPTDFNQSPATTGNAGVDPEFVDAILAHARHWDLHLAPGSPMIAVGAAPWLDPDAGPADVGVFGGPGAGSWDLDGDGFPSWWQPGPYDFATWPALGWDCDDWDPNVWPGSGC